MDTIPIRLPAKYRFKRNKIEVTNGSSPDKITHIPFELVMETTSIISSLPTALSPVCNWSTLEYTVGSPNSNFKLSDTVGLLASPVLPPNQNDRIISSSIDATVNIPSPVSIISSPVKRGPSEDEVGVEYKRLKLSNVSFIESKEPLSHAETLSTNTSYSDSVTEKNCSLFHRNGEDLDSNKILKVKVAGSGSCQLDQDSNMGSDKVIHSTKVNYTCPITIEADLKLPKALAEDSGSDLCHDVSKNRAIDLIKWAVLHNPYFREHYQPTQVLGWGGCGVVLSAHHHLNNIEVAIKIVYKGENSKSSEADILQCLNHSNIIHYIDHFEDEKAFYIVMEKFGKFWKPNNQRDEEVINIQKDLSGQYLQLPLSQGNSSSLLEYISKQLSHKVPSQLVKPMFKQLAAGLQYLHSKKIVHADIKEENILVGVYEGSYTAKYCDFGHSYIASDDNPGMRLYGTRVITAPELLPHLLAEKTQKECQEHRQVGFAQDIWALGIVLYCMIHGDIPPENTAYIQGNLDFDGCRYYPTSYDNIDDENCSDLLKRMLTIDPINRATADEIMNHVWLTCE
ncbi:kinase-like domain-containing protein [Globomyces pollinis-pini]|nr:kinase-like domain-containing protein [Globomyces pollinis-pini]